MSEPVHVLITGAAGQIGYVLTFLVASGELLGDKKVILHLLELKPSMTMLEAVMMELDDCNFPNLVEVIGTDNLREACENIDVAFLIGAIKKRPQISIQTYLEVNACTFKEQGEALSLYAKPTVKILVVGTPANTNCLVAMRFATNLTPKNFSAMTRLDHNRVIGAISKKIHVEPQDVTNVVVWGNVSSSQVVDVSRTKVNGRPLNEFICAENISKEITEIINSRTNIVYKMRGASTACSAANAALHAMKDWLFGTKPGDYVSMAVPVPDSAPYGIQPGIVFSLPCTVDENGEYHVVEDLAVSERKMVKIRESEQEVRNEAKITCEILNIPFE